MDIFQTAEDEINEENHQDAQNNPSNDDQDSNG